MPGERPVAVQDIAPVVEQYETVAPEALSTYAQYCVTGEPPFEAGADQLIVNAVVVAAIEVIAGCDGATTVGVGVGAGVVLALVETESAVEVFETPDASVTT